MDPAGAFAGGMCRVTGLRLESCTARIHQQYSAGTSYTSITSTFNQQSQERKIML
jgi:hypothetical protein